MKLGDGQAVLELIAEVGPLARLVDHSAAQVAVHQHPQDREPERRGQCPLGPLDSGINQTLGAAQAMGKLNSSKPPTSSAWMTASAWQSEICRAQCSTIARFAFGFLTGGSASNGTIRLFHFLDDGLEQAGGLRPGLGPLPFPVSLLRQMHDLRLKLHDPLVRRIVVGDFALCDALFGQGFPSGHGTFA